MKKIPALLYIGKGPQNWPFRDFQLLPEASAQALLLLYLKKLLLEQTSVIALRAHGESILGRYH